MTPTNGQRGLGWTLVAIQFVLLGGIASEVRHTRRTPGWLRGVGVVGAVAGGTMRGELSEGLMGIPIQNTPFVKVAAALFHGAGHLHADGLLGDTEFLRDSRIVAAA